MLLFVALNGATAFTAKKREPTRRAFKAASSVTREETATVPSTPTSTTGSNTAAFVYVTQAPVVPYEGDLDDDIAVGYGTAIVSCVISLALGFGLGYGT